MIRTLVAGLGTMGRSHALAYAANPAFDLVGLVNRSKVALPDELASVPLHADFYAALREVKPDLACVATYTDSHADYACAAMEQGSHVFVEKPLAVTNEQLAELVQTWQAAVEPFLMVGLGGVIGGLVVAMYLPIFTITNTLQ